MRASQSSIKFFVLAISFVSLNACSENNFVGSPESTPPKKEDPKPVNPGEKVTESFTQSENAGKVDILVVDDNSLSMETEQKKMAERFPSFVSSLADLDYQISVTTTDIDSANPEFNLGGRVLDWTGTSSKVLTPSTPNAPTVFKNTIKRVETIGCAARGSCPSGNEQPLKASMLAIDQRSSANAGVFRDGVDLAVVILSDEDEMSNGPAHATKPNDVVEHFAETFGDSKRLRVFAIVVPTDDQSCLQQQRAQTSDGNGGYPGTHAQQLALLTGGSTHSICAIDYSKSLRDISQSVRKLVSTFELSASPQPGTVNVTLTPSPKPAIGWHVEGRNLIFDTPPKAGTHIAVTYAD